MIDADSDPGLGLSLECSSPPTWYSKAHELEEAESWEALLGDSPEAREAIRVWRAWGVGHPNKLPRWDFHGRAAAVFELLEPPPLVIRDSYGFGYHDVASFVYEGFRFAGTDEMIGLWASLGVRAWVARPHVQRYRSHHQPAGTPPAEYVANYRRILRIATDITNAAYDDHGLRYPKLLGWPSARLVSWTMDLSDEEVRLLTRWDILGHFDS